MMRAGVAVGFAVIAAIHCAGCVDTTPLDFVAPEHEAGIGDGSASDGPIATCRHCVVDEGQPCRSVYDTCTAEPLCPEAFECLLLKGCFALPTFEARITCGLPCLEEVGLKVGSDPAVLALADVNTCTIGPCAAECPAAE
jgi:hypothetical protein